MLLALKKKKKAIDPEAEKKKPTVNLWHFLSSHNYGNGKNL